MAKGEVFPIINCADLPLTKAFYVDVFGGKSEYSFEHEGQEVYVTLGVGAGKVALGIGTGPAMYGETPLPATGHRVDLCIYVPDLDAAVAKAPGSKGRVVTPPSDTPWGERVAYLEDPTGTMILTIQQGA